MSFAIPKFHCICSVTIPTFYTSGEPHLLDSSFSRVSTVWCAVVRIWTSSQWAPYRRHGHLYRVLRQSEERPWIATKVSGCISVSWGLCESHTLLTPALVFCYVDEAVFILLRVTERQEKIGQKQLETDARPIWPTRVIALKEIKRLVKIAEYWPSSFFCPFMNQDEV